MNFHIHHFKTIGSTNDQLKSMLAAPEFTVVTADEQTAGRGRRDRSWHSRAGDGLYLSLLVCPQRQIAPQSLLSLAAAVATAEAIITFVPSRVDIKWPNDILIGERKVSGILIEGTSTEPSAARIVIGIGINLNSHELPKELEDRATSIFLETGSDIEPVQFRDYLLEKLGRWYQIWNAGDVKNILDRWRSLSSYAAGKEVRVITDTGEVIGTTCGLAADGALRVQLESGEVRTIISGEVQNLRAH